jgi:hypothetical protein
MGPGNLENLMEKVEGLDYFSPEDEVAIAEGKAEIARWETVSWEDLKKELGL